MAKRGLVVVESPTKVKTIAKYLDGKYVVKASMGHVRDLPKSQLGVDPKKNFKPKYVVTPAKKKVLDELVKAAEKADTLYVATDPDREGEAIGWHLAQELPFDKKNVFRITFNEITERAVKAAFTNPGRIDIKKVDAQQARRVLDRLVGYNLSPLLWKKIRRGLSAGRVQSVAVRLIVDRERAIQAFVPVEYWTLHARLTAKVPPEFTATLREVDGQKAELASEDATHAVMARLEGARFIVRSVTRGERKKNPAPPFITSTMQQDAGRKLGFSAKKTMTVAQQLYEGIEVGEEGAVGLITYMRTDSVRIAAEAQEAARTWATNRLGAEYLPDAPPAYKSRGSAQEAHEAIRPSDVNRDPKAMARFLTKDQLALYRLIWERFMASQLMPAVYDTVAADIEAAGTVFRAQGQTLKFKGFTAIYVESREDEDPAADEDAESAVPPLEEGEALGVLGLDPKQHFTQPPPRFTEASLIKKLEEDGIGRPSTYASILGTIINDRGYVHRERRTLSPTQLGIEVTDLLLPFFRDIMDVEFTAQMEGELDKVEEGELKWSDAVQDFYTPFQKDLKAAEKGMPELKGGVETGEACPECGEPLKERWGRFGKFIACSAYPECKYKKNLPGSERPEDEPTDEKCPTCERPMVIKHGRFGKFIACSGYPECKTTKPVTLGIACPECAKGQIVERRSRKGRTFFGCSAYPDCKFVLWQRPVQEPCPKCAALFLTERVARGRRTQRCWREGCDFSREAEITVA
ncbi:MAG TPA: type I DNA topoisomerase [Candidatus Binatia bacterium]|nr:type I DNA topoisomerase [Candidatus Binatia bacterium]